MRRFIALADALNVTLASLALAALLTRLYYVAAHLLPLPFALGGLLGFIAADVTSGLLHWFCDTYFDARTPLIGPMLIAPFRQHHVDPGALSRHGVLECNGNNCMASLPLLLLARGCLAPGALPPIWHDAIGGFFCAFAMTLCFTNQIHAWAHTPNAPRAVRVLQRTGLLLAPERHGVHHRGERAYAVVSGWSNRWLDPLLARTEAALAAAGIQTHTPDKGTNT